MRITGGTMRGRKLATPNGRDVRPTSDMMRQAIFNIIQKYGAPDGDIVLDAFCGTGALGLESLSRGADFCVFCDSDQDSLRICRENVTTLLGADAKTYSHIMRADMGKAGTAPPIFTARGGAGLVFLDPPYRKGLAGQSLRALHEYRWLAPASLIVIECEKAAPVEWPESGFVMLDRRTYGQSDLILLRAPAPPPV